jgi:hypothetical protein
MMFCVDFEKWQRRMANNSIIVFLNRPNRYRIKEKKHHLNETLSFLLNELHSFLMDDSVLISPLLNLEFFLNMTTITQDKIHKIIRLKTINLEMWLTLFVHDVLFHVVCVVHDADEVAIGYGLISVRNIISLPILCCNVAPPPPPHILQPFLTPQFQHPLFLVLETTENVPLSHRQDAVSRYLSLYFPFNSPKRNSICIPSL